MLPLVRSGNIVLGVDISNEALQVCSALSLNVMELDIKGDSIDPLYEYIPFDVIFMTDILEH